MRTRATDMPGLKNNTRTVGTQSVTALRTTTPPTYVARVRIVEPPSEPLLTPGRPGC